MADAPGVISRYEPATGLLVRGISVNGHYLLVESCNVYQRQDIEMKWFVQGGPRATIADIGRKYIEGEIICPVRVKRDGSLEDGLVALLNNAETPSTALRLDTNHAMSHLKVTAENGGTDNNELITFDCMLVKDLTITSDQDTGVKINVSIIGVIDTRTESNLISPPTDFRLGRNLSFSDCNASRYQSAMRTVSSLNITIKNDIELLQFLLPDTATTRSDQPQYMGVKSCEWGGNFTEIMRLGIERETFIHGGWMRDENLILNFGPIKLPLFNISEQNLTPKLLKRDTKFFSQVRASMKPGRGVLFVYTEVET